MIEYDKANVTSSYPQLTVYEAATILDKAYNALISLKVTGNNHRGASFETDIKSISDLSPLVKHVDVEFGSGGCYPIANIAKFNLPPDFNYFVQTSLNYMAVNSPYDSLNSRLIPVKLVAHSVAEKFFASLYNMPWVKNPVCYIENDSCFVVYDMLNKPEVGENKKAHLVYIKKPISFVESLKTTDTSSSGSGNASGGNGGGSSSESRPSDIVQELETYKFEQADGMMVYNRLVFSSANNSVTLRIPKAKDTFGSRYNMDIRVLDNPYVTYTTASVGNYDYIYLTISEQSQSEELDVNYITLTASVQGWVYLERTVSIEIGVTYTPQVEVPPVVNPGTTNHILLSPIQLKDGSRYTDLTYMRLLQYPDNLFIIRIPYALDGLAVFHGRTVMVVGQHVTLGDTWEENYYLYATIYIQEGAYNDSVQIISGVREWDGTESSSITVKVSYTNTYIPPEEEPGGEDPGQGGSSGNPSVPVDPQFPVPEAIDMGLSVKWASFNVGASSPRETGKFIGWGDPTGVLTSNNINSYAVGNESDNIAGDADYDVATAKWGSNWKIPTFEQFEELFDSRYCYAEDVPVEGDSTYMKITSKRTGNSIIIPRCGIISDGSSIYKSNFAWYWTSDADEEDPGKAFYAQPLAASSAFQEVIYRQISDGTTAPYNYRMLVRAIYDEPTSWVQPLEPDPGQEEPQEPEVPTPTITSYAMREVDLGLPSGTIWADCNLGARLYSYNDVTQPIYIDPGQYFDWGDLYESASASLHTYQYYEGKDPGFLLSDGQYYPYRYINEMRDLGNNISGSPDYDAAYWQTGGIWQLPTPSQISELVNGCNWSLSRQDDWGGVGRIVLTGESKTNHNTINFVVSGYKWGEDLSKAMSSSVYFWSGSVDRRTDASNNYNAEAFSYDTSNTTVTAGNVYLKTDVTSGKYHARFHALPIRPVLNASNS